MNNLNAELIKQKKSSSDSKIFKICCDVEHRKWFTNKEVDELNCEFNLGPYSPFICEDRVYDLSDFEEFHELFATVLKTIQNGVDVNFPIHNYVHSKLILKDGIAFHNENEKWKDILAGYQIESASSNESIADVVLHPLANAVGIFSPDNFFQFKSSVGYFYFITSCKGFLRRIAFRTNTYYPNFLWQIAIRFQATCESSTMEELCRISKEHGYTELDQMLKKFRAQPTIKSEWG